MNRNERTTTRRVADPQGGRGIRADHDGNIGFIRLPAQGTENVQAQPPEGSIQAFRSGCMADGIRGGRMNMGNEKVVTVAAATTRTTQTCTGFPNSFATVNHTGVSPKAPTKGHLTNSYEDFRRIIQKTVRRYPALATALSALSMLSIVLTAGLAEQRPAWATVAALAGMLAALTLRGADCSTTGVLSRTESNRRHAVNTWATASPAHWTARRSSRFQAGTISEGGREL